MRNIDLIVIHCSATPADMDIGVEEIRDWHIERGWDDVGYHYIIRRDGSVEAGRPVEIPGAHAYGHNANSIGICLIGGINRDGHAEANFSREQWASLDYIVSDLTSGPYRHAQVVGHRELDEGKECPSFDVKGWLNGA